MRIKGIYIILIFGLLAALGAGSCKKTATLTQGGILKFSDDTLKFDTVFTAEGSFTTGILIYNPQNEAVMVNSVRMESGASSFFHLNVDGRTGTNATNIRIAPHDSIYVFATVKINPNDTTNPFLIVDHLIANMNGRDFSMTFTAYGQNAHYIVSDSITATTTTWLTDLPYVVIHNCIVAPNCTLNIPPRCRVYMHQDARIIMYWFSVLNIGQGSTTGDSVVFQGDRLDRAYFGYIGYPGEWCGIWLIGKSTANISHTIIKNCGGDGQYWQYLTKPAAIRVDDSAVLNIDHSIVKNSIGFGILNFQGTVNASNCLVHTTGGAAFVNLQGGYDSLVNCTFANYGTAAVAHSSEPTVALLNYFRLDQTHIYFGDLNGIMKNCIVYGSLDSELICDSSANAAASFRIDHCLVKMGTIREPFVTFAPMIFNQDPMFKDPQNGDFHLKTGSPAIDKGNGISSGTDLDDKPRVVNSNVDIGCYESQ